MTDQVAEVDSPQTETETADLAEASTDDIRAALGLEPAPEATQEEGPQAEGEVEQPAEAQETPQEHAEEVAETEEERLAKRRIRPRTAEDQQVIDLYRSEGFEGTFDDAAQVIYGQRHQPQPQAQQQTAPAQDPHAADRRQAHQLQTEITQLEAKVNESAENLDTVDALKYQRAIMKRELALQKLENRYERNVERKREQQFNVHRSTAEESRDRVFDTYPELADGNSVTRKQFDAYVANMQQDPNFATVFDSPKWPELMAAQFAAQVPMQAQQLPAPVQAPPQQAPVMGNQARVLTSGTTAQPANSQPTAQQVVQNLPNLSRDDLYTALGQPDGQRYLT